MSRPEFLGGGVGGGAVQFLVGVFFPPKEMCTSMVRFDPLLVTQTQQEIFNTYVGCVP